MQRPLKAQPVLLLAAALAAFGTTALQPAGAETATLVADVHPGPPAPAEVPVPRTFMPLPGGSAFFVPDATPEAGSILWATDGTDAGTRALGTFGSPRFFGTLHGLAFFLAALPDDPSPFERLWRTDGTGAGTFSLSPAGLVLGVGSAGGRLLASYCTEEGDCGLYATDGSAAGTVLLAPGQFTDLTQTRGKEVYFFGADGNDIDSLWHTDGTPEGTRAVRHLRPTEGTWLLTAAGSRLFYKSGDSTSELWTSDGTARGTALVRNFFEPGPDFVPRINRYLKPTAEGQVTFVAARAGLPAANLWRSDGTRRGTVPLTAFQGTSSVDGLRDDQIAVLGRRTLFVAYNGFSGARLWSSRGSLATTAPLVACPGGCPELLAGTALVPVGNRILFAARDADHGAELWASDGTEAGTRLLADLCPGACDAAPAGFTALAGRIWFRVTLDGIDHLARTDGTAAGTAILAPIPTAIGLDLATDGTGSHRVFFAGTDALDGAQPWVTDGTVAGTARVSVLPATAASSEPANLTALGGRLLFTAWDGTQTALWSADASGAAAVAGTAVPGKVGPAQVTAAGGRAFFVRDPGDGGAVQLWVTDGTAAGSSIVTLFPDRTLGDLHDFGGRLLFLATPAGDGERHIPSAWTSDGTAAGTVQLFTLPDDTLGVNGLTLLGAEIYLEVDRESGSDIVRSDGTAAGTRTLLRIADCCFGIDNSPVRFARAADAVYFTAFDEFYKTDSTAGGTMPALIPDADGTPPIVVTGGPFTLGGRVFVFGTAPDLDSDVLYRIDAGAGGDSPVPLAAAETFGLSEDPGPQTIVLGGAVFFRAWDPDHGTELWRTDGTPEGTRVLDLVPGPPSSDPQGLAAAGGRLYFSAGDGLHGRELWTSDGTAAGTRLVDDIASGAVSSAPMLMTPVGDRLYFTADDGFAGREPWSVAISPF